MRWRGVLFTLLVATCLLKASVAQSPRNGNGNGNSNGNNQNPKKVDSPSQRGTAKKELTEVADKGEGVLKSADPWAESFKLAEDELIVKLKPSTTKENKGKALGLDQGNTEKRVIKGRSGKGDLVLLKVKDEKGNKPSNRASLKAAADKIKANADVEYIEPNYFVNRTQLPTNDPSIGQLWGMLSAGGGANVAGAWARNYTSCDDVVIGVIDTGIQMEHPELRDLIWTNPGEIADDGIDNDGNAIDYYADMVDDVHWYDFYWYDNTIYDPEDGDEHATHVAGTIAATGNNGLGVSGVCQRGLKIISAKFLSAYGGYTFDAVYALTWLLDLKTRYNLNLVATSNSWGGGGYSYSLEEAIRAHRDAGILFIAAAGNDGVDTDALPEYGYPAAYTLENIISVGAINSDGAVASYSNYGAKSVDVFAPGTNILSTWPVDAYMAISGTSMATPHVTGAAALYAAAYRKLKGTWPTYTEIKAAILDTGVPSAAYAGKAVSGKRLNVDNLMAYLTGEFTPLPPPPIPAKRGMYARMTTWVYTWTDTSYYPYDVWFYCLVRVRAFDNTTNVAIPGFSVKGTWSISPDHNGYTDPWWLFPMTITGSAGSSTAAWTDSPDWLIARSTLQRWYPWRYGSTFPGTRCRFDLGDVMHPNYVLNRAQSNLVATAIY